MKISTLRLANLIVLSASLVIYSLDANARSITTQRSLSLGAGFSSPSAPNALRENSAGLISHRALGVMTGAGDSSSSGSFYSYGLFAGGGAAAGALDFRKDQDTGTQTSAFGFAALLPGTGVAAGLTCGASYENTLGLSCSDLSLLTNPGGAFRVGVVAKNLLDRSASDIFGVGVSIDVTRQVTLVIDGATDRDFSQKSLKPAFGFDLGMAQFTAGYGVSLGDLGSSEIRSGIAAGMGLEVLRGLRFQAHYNYIAAYFASLAWSF